MVIAFVRVLGDIMSADELALLATIDAAPTDDLPRLVYADWLDEHDRPVRAEFVRLQCEIARLETHRGEVRPHHSGLWSRQEAMLAGLRVELLGPLAGLPAAAKVDFDRGFASKVEVRVGDFLPHAAALDAAQPRPQVRVTHAAADLLGFVQSPHLRCVTQLGVYAPNLDEMPPEWPDDDDMLRAAGRLSRLEVLDLEGCGIGDWVGRMLAGLHFPTLVELDLSNNFISDVGVADLLVADLPKRLILSGNPITDQGAFELADRLRLSRVEYLNVRRTDIGRAGHAALLATFDRSGKKVDLF